MGRLPTSDLIAGLAGIVGEANVSTASADRVAYSVDFWPRTQIWKMGGEIDRYPPDAIVWPANEEQTAKVVAFCNEHKVPIVPYGAGSGVCGGTVPIHGGVIIDVKRMRRVTHMDPVSLTAQVQAGINGMQLEDRLNARNVTLGHFPSSIMCSTLGGWLAARSAGQFSSKYGKIEDMVVGVRVVLADGTVLDTADRTPGSPDWTQLVVGSEGTLGVITGATLKVHPYPEARALRGWRFRKLTDGITAMRLLMQAGLKPMVLRLYDPFDTLMALGKDKGEQEEPSAARGLMGMFQSKAKRLAIAAGLSAPGVLNTVVHSIPTACLLIVGFEGQTDVVRQDMWHAGRILSEAGGSDAGQSAGLGWLKHRYRVSFKQPKMYQAGAWVDTMEVATTWDRLHQLFQAVMRSVGPHALIMAHFSHAYREGCSIYFTFASFKRDSRRAEEAYQRTWDAALSAVQGVGATASHHHGVGLLKKDAMITEHGEMLRAWRAIKDAFDPNGIMNPGKLFPDVGHTTVAGSSHRGGR